MKSTIILVLLTAICVLGSLQHGCFKKTTNAKSYRPTVFEDMIPTEYKSYCDVDFKDDSDILNLLDEALKSSLSAPLNNPTDILTNRKNYYASEAEVFNLLKAALSFKSSGKMDKAMKLFQRAASMAPNNPDVLNQYGEFIEFMLNDIVSADKFYFKALTHSPDHKAALSNRMRTGDIVEKLDLNFFKGIDEKRDILKVAKRKNPFYDMMKQKAFYLHIYHTVGIEGNTMTLDQVRHILETGQAVSGKSILEHNEILGLESAMKYVKLLARYPIIEVQQVLGIHQRVHGHVDPLVSGVFREEQVYVGSHVPPSSKDLPQLMKSYVDWLNSEEAHSMHPVRCAALAHYKLVDIHPFLDGNGRTSRLIMNLVLIRADYPPVMILQHHKGKYYEYLNLANEGDVRPFVRFIAKCADLTLDAYLCSIQAGSDK